LIVRKNEPFFAAKQKTNNRLHILMGRNIRDICKISFIIIYRLHTGKKQYSDNEEGREKEWKATRRNKKSKLIVKIFCKKA
jgi:hypothetical protein